MKWSIRRSLSVFGEARDSVAAIYKNVLGRYSFGLIVEIDSPYLSIKKLVMFVRVLV
jgi:hypothetical protein|tara:strand:- start:1642 stop:1812 length:171 start_codon:yes stop_codon:yes gene_type:complete